MPTPPDSLPDDASALKALLVAAQAENERLIAIIKELQRYRFGPRSEKIDPGQLALMLEDVEQAIAASAARSAIGMLVAWSAQPMWATKVWLVASTPSAWP